MTKIPRDIKAFAQRVKMSRQTSTFILVEGRNNDRPFYERLLKNIPAVSSSGFSVRVVEDLSIKGKCAGGKPFALTLFAFLDSSGLLNQSNSEGNRRIGFMLDKDYDEFEGTIPNSSHVILTESADVEAEILRVGKIRRAIASTYGITRSQAIKVAPKGMHPIDVLAQHWAPWIILRAMSCQCGAHTPAKYGAVSKIHEEGFGPLDSSAEAALRATVRAHALAHGVIASVDEAENDASSRIAAHRGHELVKGKWLTKYIRYLVESKLENHVVSYDVQPDVLTKVCLESVDFSAGWTAYYRTRVEKMMQLTP